MNEEAPKVEIKVSHTFTDRTDVRSLMISVLTYAQAARSNALLLRDLAGNQEGSIEVDRGGFRLAMSSQVALSDALLDAMNALMDIATAKAAEAPNAAGAAPH